MKSEFYAHSLPEKSPEDWHRLEEHLKSVAEMARRFEEDFKAGEWGYLSKLASLNRIFPMSVFLFVFVGLLSGSCYNIGMEVWGINVSEKIQPL